MKKHTFNACPSCNRLMRWETDKQKCPNCGHEEPLNFTNKRAEPGGPIGPDDPILDALTALQDAVNGISGYWDESVANAMQQADQAIARRTKAMLELGLTVVDGTTVPNLIENADLLIGCGQDELVRANEATKSGLASLLLIALIQQVTCVRSRIKAILSAVSNDERKPDGQAS